MSELNNKDRGVIKWEAPSRYFEKKPPSYFRAITVLAMLISVLLFFFKEGLLIFLVWVIFFVAYVRAAVSPISTEYSLDKFGLSYFGGRLSYDKMTFFSVVKKNEGRVIRIFSHFLASELCLVMPKEEKLANYIIKHLKQRVPFMEKTPKTEVEKFGEFLSRAAGFS